MPYTPNAESDRQRMLQSIGASHVDELFEQIPQPLRTKGKLNVPGPLSEIELRRFASSLSAKNADLDSYASFLGAGIYDHYIPSTVNAVIGRSEFYTAYTPYQPELSQGGLQSIFEFQTLVSRLSGMDVANASMYDGATALAEAALMASAVTAKSEWVVSGCVHPAYIETLRTYAWASGHRLIECGRSAVVTDFDRLSGALTDETACVIVQNPNFFGSVESLEDAGRIAHERGALLVVSFDPTSLGVLKPPGEFAADIAVGEGQALGLPMSYGGPLLGLFACKKEFVRQMPGRVVGATVDTKGRRGYVLTLQTREQHIRREKATSNICTNQALCALAATVYLATLGRHGLRDVANLCLQKAHYAAREVASAAGFDVPFKARFFKEFVVKCPEPVAEINARLLNKKIIGGLDLGKRYPDLAGHMLLCVTEKRSRQEIDELISGMAR